MEDLASKYREFYDGIHGKITWLEDIDEPNASNIDEITEYCDKLTGALVDTEAVYSAIKIKYDKLGEDMHSDKYRQTAEFVKNHRSTINLIKKISSDHTNKKNKLNIYSHMLTNLKIVRESSEII
jgi:hypothetical protein